MRQEQQVGNSREQERQFKSNSRLLDPTDFQQSFRFEFHFLVTGDVFVDGHHERGKKI